MTYFERLQEINDRFRYVLNHDKDIDIELVEERQKIIDSILYRDEHKWDDEII